MNKKRAGIYVHIPFCVRKCNYCDFLSAPGDDECIREYCCALIKEIEEYGEKAKDYKADTIYFGGGTPSILRPELFSDIVKAIGRVFDISEVREFTVEMNPGTVTEEKLICFKENGVNRLSIGIQSACDEELRLLGRIHNFEEAKRSFFMAREAGFTNISVDVISSLPNQTVEAYEKTLDRILALEPEHISSYSLIIEPGTPFFAEYGEKGKKANELPDEETDRIMYALTKRKLLSAGYTRYEISNYSKPGYESRHNSSYWTGKEYFGLGLGASSFIDNVRYSNVRDIKEYIRHPSSHIIEEKLDKEGLMSEYMILGLRMTRGISVSEFSKRFGITAEERYGDVMERFIKEKVLVREGDMLRLTDYGLDVSNTVFAEFL